MKVTIHDLKAGVDAIIPEPTLATLIKVDVEIDAKLLTIPVTKLPNAS